MNLTFNVIKLVTIKFLLGDFVLFITDLPHSDGFVNQMVTKQWTSSVRDSWLHYATNYDVVTNPVADM
jgi:hypothetical protein